MTQSITIDGVPYNVKTNAWGPNSYDGSQELTIGGSSVFRINQQNASGDPNQVQSFPAVYRGFAQDGRQSANSGMPVRVGDISSAPTGFHTNSTTVSGNFNTAYDVYFSDDSSVPSEGPPDTFLMVWLNRSSGFNPVAESYSCGATPPAGFDACPEPGTLNIPGVGEFYAFVGLQGQGKLVISYVRTQATGSLDFDLMTFVDHAISQGYSSGGRPALNENMYLYSVQAGFEIKSGGAGLEVSNFYALVNQ